jgi:colicin import membrane protein
MARRHVARFRPSHVLRGYLDDREARKAALAFETEQGRRERARLKEEAAQAKKRERRDRAVAKARAALEKSRREQAKLETALRRARG